MIGVDKMNKVYFRFVDKAVTTLAMHMFSFEGLEVG